jgi:hypothetical protein
VQALKADDITKISVTLGEHLVTAVSSDGKDKWKGVVDLDKPLQKVVLIELVKVRAARQAAERQIILLQQEIAAKEQKAKDVAEATRVLEMQQQEVKKQRQEIADQIDVLQKQVRQEESAAQADEASARQDQVTAQTAAGQGTKLGNVVATVSNVESGSEVGSAANHMAKARELQDQIIDLNRKLERLNTGELAPGVPDHDPKVAALPRTSGTSPATWPLSIHLPNDSAVGVADTGMTLMLKHMGWIASSADLYVISATSNGGDAIHPYTSDRTAADANLALFRPFFKSCDGSKANVNGSDVWCFHVIESEIKRKRGKAQSLGEVTSNGRPFEVLAIDFDYQTSSITVQVRVGQKAQTEAVPGGASPSTGGMHAQPDVTQIPQSKTSPILQTDFPVVNTRAFHAQSLAQFSSTKHVLLLKKFPHPSGKLTVGSEGVRYDALQGHIDPHDSFSVPCGRVQYGTRDQKSKLGPFQVLILVDGNGYAFESQQAPQIIEALNSACPASAK